MIDDKYDGRWHWTNIGVCKCTDGKHGTFFSGSPHELNRIENELEALKIEVEELRERAWRYDQLNK